MSKRVDTPRETNLYFVYGSLKKDFGNHFLLRNAQLLGETETYSKHKMISLGSFPGVIYQGGTDRIKGEVYLVTDPNTKMSLDRLEGYPDFYDRHRVITELGTCWMYALAPKFLDQGDYRNYDAVPSGYWRKK